MKDTKSSNKRIVTGISLAVVVLIIVIIGIWISNKKPVVPDVQRTDSFEITTEIDDIRVSGDASEVTNIKVNIITKDNKTEYEKYSNIVKDIEKQYMEIKLNDVMFLEVSLLNQNNEEVVLDEPMTVYLDNLYIDIYTGFFDYAVINKDNSLEEYEITISNYPSGTDGK